MKVTMIGHKYVPSREGGVEIVVEELSTRMADKGHEITLFNRKRKKYKKINEYKGCKVKNIFTIDKKSLDAIVYSFFATIKGVFSKADVLHFHAEGPCFFLWMTRFSRKKIVVTIHGLDWQRNKWGGLATKVLKFGEKMAVKYADEIIVLSKNNQHYFNEKYNRETVFIPNGISAPIVREAKEIIEKYGINKEEYILFLARIVPEKGLHYLIDAFTSMSKEEKHGKKLVIAGGSSHTDGYYQSIVDKCAGHDDIILTGFVTGEVLYELYSNAFLYVLPSDIEGMPMSLLEAMSYGNMCLVSDIPENVEVIDESCASFKKADVDDLKKKLIGILSEEKQNLVHEGLKDWDAVVSDTVEIYQKEINV